MCSVLASVRGIRGVTGHKQEQVPGQELNHSKACFLLLSVAKETKSSLACITAETFQSLSFGGMQSHVSE